MPWFFVDDDFAFHPKAIAAGDTAIGLWVRAGSYAMRYLTEGLVSHEALRQLRAKPAQVNALVDAKTSPQGCGLWVPVDGGYRFHEWSERQRTRAQVEADRVSAAARKRRQRAREKGGTSGDVSRRDSRRDSETAECNGRIKSAQNRADLTQKSERNQRSTRGESAGEGDLSRRESHDPRPAPPRTNPLLTLAGRLTEASAQDLNASLPAEMISEWQEIAGPSVDLEDEARAYLARHGDTTPHNPRGAWLGWLRAARRRHDATQPGEPQAAAGAHRQCAVPGCVGGWLPETDDGRRPPCPDCKPHLRPIRDTEAS